MPPHVRQGSNECKAMSAEEEFFYALRFTFLVSGQQSSEGTYLHPKRLCREDLVQFYSTRLFARRFDKRGWTHNRESPADTKKVDL